MLPDDRAPDRAPRPQNPPPQPQAMRLRLPLARPRWTYIFLAIIGIVFVGQTVTGGSESSANLIRWGANFAPFVHAGEYWRLITANFLHIGILHIAFNGYALYALGAQAEALYGPRRYVTMYLLSGISGAIFSYMFTQGLSAGASTSLFGLFGALVVFYYKQRKALGAMGQQQLMSLGITLAANILLSLTNPRIDNWGHVGGFLGGLILAWFFCPTYERVNPFANAFQPAQPAPTPELNNGELMDTNSLYKQRFVVVAFVLGLVILTALATLMQR